MVQPQQSSHAKQFQAICPPNHQARLEVFRTFSTVPFRFCSAFLLSLRTQAEPYTLPSQRDASIRVDEPVVTERPDVDVIKTKYYVNSDGEVVGQKQVHASVRY